MPVGILLHSECGAKAERKCDPPNGVPSKNSHKFFSNLKGIYVWGHRYAPHIWEFQISVKNIMLVKV